MQDVWKPHVTVAAIAERNGCFLMVEETSGGRRVLNQPAGHLDPGETLADAVVRETLEETAWHFRPSSLVGVYRWEKPGSDKTFLRVCFAGEVSDFEASRELDAEIHRADWFTLDELRSYDLRSPMVERCLRDYLDGTRYPLELLQEMD